MGRRRQTQRPRVVTWRKAWRVEPLGAERWRDLAALFGPRGACAGCWCMWWRLPQARWDAQKGAKNRRAFEAVVRSGAPTGVLAYDGAAPVGWCAVAPRHDYIRLQKARTLAPVDTAEVWSITCFFVARVARGRGLMRALIDGAVACARASGARIVEAYPVDSAGELGDAFVFTGTPEPFLAAGFEEVARRSRTRPILRLRIAG